MLDKMSDQILKCSDNLKDGETLSAISFTNDKIVKYMLKRSNPNLRALYVHNLRQHSISMNLSASGAFE